MQNIAIADLGYTITVILPTVITSAADGWILGNVSCIACAYLQFLFGIANIVMVCSLSVCKLAALLCPMRIRFQTKTTGHILVGILWIVALIYPLQLIFLKRDLPYNSYLYRCMTDSREDTMWEYLELINAGIFITIPLLVILVTAIWSSAFVHKVAGLNRQGLLIVLSVSFVFVMSWCPLLVYNFAYIFTSPSIAFYQVGVFIVFISSASNPFLYFFTSKKFGDFVKSRIRRLSAATTDLCYEIS